MMNEDVLRFCLQLILDLRSADGTIDQEFSTAPSEDSTESNLADRLARLSELSGHPVAVLQARIDAMHWGQV